MHGPLFGPAISKHSEALLKHRNESAHFSSKFNRQKTYDFMTRVIEIFEVLNEDEHATEVRDLRAQLHFDEYLLFVKNTQPQVEESIKEAEHEATLAQEVESEPALVPEQDGGVQPESKKEAKATPAASKASSQQNKAEKFFSEADKNLKETIKITAWMKRFNTLLRYRSD